MAEEVKKGVPLADIEKFNEEYEKLVLNLI
jgi:hypothetical protein